MTAGLIIFGVLILAGCAYTFWCWGRSDLRDRREVERGKALVDVTGTIEPETDPEKVAADWERIHGGER